MGVFHTDSISESDFALILSILRRGGVIGFPTDTAYGLGADPLNETALSRIFKIKGRTETKPILLLVASITMAETVSEPDPVFYEVAQQFWPGPLTVVLPAKAFVSARVTAGTKTVGLRWPLSPWATKLIERFGSAITATSANRSGLPTAVTAEEVEAQLGNSIDALIDGGALPSRSGSTMLDLTGDLPVLLREGPISFERLHEFFKGRIRREVA
jgi:L-threonylcarbamoyladenylate synthase